MTRVDFYIAPEAASDTTMFTACRLAEKAWRHGTQVYIHTASPLQAEQLDTLLWTYRDGSFVPHARRDDEFASASPVVIGHTDEPPMTDEMLINIADAVPTFFSRFQRVAEIVGTLESQKVAARDRFRFYRDRGYELDTHHLKS